MFLLVRVTFFCGNLAFIAASSLHTTFTDGYTTGVWTKATISNESSLRNNEDSIVSNGKRLQVPSGVSSFDSATSLETADPTGENILHQISSYRKDIPSGKDLREQISGHQTIGLEVLGTDGSPASRFKTHLEPRFRGSRFKRLSENDSTKNVRRSDKHYKETNIANGHLIAADVIWESVPKPMAQNSTDIPNYFTRNDFPTFPDNGFGDITPLIPLVTRTKENELKNPFYPVTSETYGAYVILIISVIIFSIGILGNITIMCIVCHNYYMRSISNSLLANLALWDFIIIFFCLPLVVFHELTKDWLLGEFSCKIIPYIEVASLGVTTFTLCALCIDRFRAATNVQMYYEMIENCTSTAAKLAVIWIGALLLALPELLIRQLVREEREPAEVMPCERCVVRISTTLPDTLYVLGLTYDSARLWWYFGCYFCLPTLFTICCSLATAQKIRKAERANIRGNRKQIQLEGQMNCMVVALAIVYGFCIIPENICNIVSVYMAAGVGMRTLDILHLVSQLLLFCKSAITPVLLLALCRPFSKAFMDCCCCCCEECGTARSATASEDAEHDCTTELELSPFSTIQRREVSSYTAVGTHC